MPATSWLVEGMGVLYRLEKLTRIGNLDVEIYSCEFEHFFNRVGSTNHTINTDCNVAHEPNQDPYLRPPKTGDRSPE